MYNIYYREVLQSFSISIKHMKAASPALNLSLFGLDAITLQSKWDWTAASFSVLFNNNSSSSSVTLTHLIFVIYFTRMSISRLESGAPYLTPPGDQTQPNLLQSHS